MAGYRNKLESDAVCPFCKHKLKYKRNSTLYAGVTRYYICPKCGAKVRITPGKPKVDAKDKPKD